MITLSEFIKKYSGKKVDWDGAYGGQCVDLARQYIHEVLGLDQPRGVRGACNFWDNYETDPNLNRYFDKLKNTPLFLPKAGDIMIWNCNAGGGYGHISIVTSANLRNFVSFDQNWRALNVCELTNHNYTNVLGVFRRKQATGNNSGNSTSNNESAISKLENVIEELTKIKNELKS